MENSGEPTIHIIFPQILTLLARTQHVLLSNITFFVIFAVLDVSLAVNLCINCSFFTFIMNYSTINSSIRNLNLSVPTLDGVPPGPSLKAPMNLSEKL